MKLEVGMYVRNEMGKIYKIENEDCLELTLHRQIDNENNKPYKIVGASHDIKKLIKFMDLLVIENKVKDLENKELYFFNPVRCDGFTTYADGKHCMIINMDYIVPIENIKVYKILTFEQFEIYSYKVEK